MPIKFLQKFDKIFVDNVLSILYNRSCVTGRTYGFDVAGCGSAWLERLVWDQEVAGSNPVTPIWAKIYAGVVQW